MTVNERLYASDLMDNFDKAIQEKNRDKVVAILESVELNQQSIEPILKQYNLE